MIHGAATSLYQPYQNNYAYGAQYAQRTQAAQTPSVRASAVSPAQPELPVTPVSPVRAVAPAQSAPLNKANLLMRWENDPAAMAVRGRIQYGGETAGAEAAAQGSDAQSVQETMEEAECQTCKDRKYQDGSDDPGVSFKTASHIDPDQAAAVVRGHEQEHVVREQAKADREDREVVSQSVTLHTGICPECGRTYVSGGTTRTVTRSAQDPVQEAQPEKGQENAA